jgi:cellulose synthase (UDP-forming)
MVQILRMENPLFASGLTFSQRLCYFNATTHFLFAIPRLIFLVTPLVYLLLGRVNIYGYSLAVFAYALPHIVLSDMTNSRIQGRYRFSFWNEIYEAVLAPYILFPTLLALVNPRLGKFNVTAKGGVVRRSFFDRRIALPFLFLLALNLAGLVMAERRWVTDPFHHDTVIMNAVWTAYNVVILSVATSVAWERKQRRRQVRVNVRVPLLLVTPDGQRVAGVTTQVSGRGTMTRLSRALPLSRGSSVVLALQGTPPCEIHAQVASRSKRRVNLCFPELSLAQEKYLVSLIYSRPEAWVDWQRQRPSDRPLRSLGHIVWLALRGIGVVLVGFFSRRHPDDLEAAESRGKQRVPAVAASIAVAAALTLAPTQLRASDSSPTSANGNANAAQNNDNARGTAPVLIFHDHYELRSIAGTNNVGMSGAGAAQNFFLDMPLTKIISSASLNLHYRAPLVGANESWLDVWLNGTRVGSLPLLPGSQQTDVALPADLLTNQNTLTLQLQGNCAACKRARRAWVAIDPSSELALSGTRLPLPNDLALLPIPFFDPAFQHAWSLPVVFSRRPDFAELLAASTVTSWFGVFSDFRGVRFPVSLGDLPHGNAVVLALRDSDLARELSLPSRPGAQIAIRDNPVDPYGKLLILAGDDSEQLVTAARSLVTRNNAQAHADAVLVKSVDESPRQKYQAPRWLASDKPAAIGTYTTNERLRLKGSGSINIYFRIPPDLLLEARDSLPLLLKYSYAHVAEGERAWLHVRLNNRDIDSIRLQPASSSVDAETVVRLPTGRFQPYTNTLTIDVDFGRAGAAATAGQYAAIHRDSAIDLSGLPHSVILPRLELFADSGYPFTAWPDLSHTAVVLSQAPDAEEYETLLDMMGFFGAQTGLAATGVTITDAAGLDAARDKDLILLGNAASQALLTQWAGAMPVNLASDSIRPMPWQMRVVHPEWPFRLSDRRKLDALLAARPSLDVLVEDFVSPFRGDRSVLAIVPRGSGSPAAIAAMFTPALEKGPIYGGVAVAENGRFRSFLVGDFAYHAGHLDRFQQTEVFLLEHYFFIPVLIVPLGFIIAAWLRATTERVAARRLAYEKIGF